MTVLYRLNFVFAASLDGTLISALIESFGRLQ